jgi:hypothetical protein
MRYGPTSHATMEYTIPFCFPWFAPSICAKLRGDHRQLMTRKEEEAWLSDTSIEECGASQAVSTVHRRYR